MALTITASHGFIAYNDGTVILPSMGVVVNGGNGFVQYVKSDGTVTGTDFNTNSAILFPYCMSSVNGAPVVPIASSAKWYYGSTAIQFSDTSSKSVAIDGKQYSYKPCTNFLDANKNAIFGLTTYTVTENGKNYDMPALVIVKNIASSSIFTDVTFKMEGKTVDNHFFTCSKILPIQLTEGNSIDAFIIDNGDSVISQGETTVSLQGGIQENGAKIDVTKIKNAKWEQYTKGGWKEITAISGEFDLATENANTTNKTKITIYEPSIYASLLLRFSAEYNNNTYMVTHEVLDMNDGYTFYDGCNYPGRESSVTYNDAITLKPVVKTKAGVTDTSHTWKCDVIMADADGNPIKKKSTDAVNWTDSFSKCDGTEDAHSYAYADLFAEGRTYIQFIYNVYNVTV